METNDMTQAVETSEQTKPKLCIDCKHIATNGSGNSATYKCMAPQNVIGINLVDGTKIYKLPFCSEHRAIVTSGCSDRGIWFEQAPPKLQTSAQLLDITSSNNTAKPSLGTMGLELMDADAAKAARESAMAKLAAAKQAAFNKKFGINTPNTSKPIGIEDL